MNPSKRLRIGADQQDPQTEEEYTSTLPYLPVDVLEAILARLPVKSIIRFKAVCKHWNNILSDPYFAKIQTEYGSSSFPIHFLVRESLSNPTGSGSFGLLKLEDQGFQVEAVLEEVCLNQAVIICSCNGIVLLKESSCWSKTYVLLNPCSRMMSSKIQWSGPFPNAHGLCHDPTTGDYKVVIITDTTCSVFSCKTKAWTKIDKRFPNYSGINEAGVFVNGTLYWIAREKQLLFFDGIHDKCGVLPLPLPRLVQDFGNKVLFSVGGRLGLCMYSYKSDNSKMVILICIMDGNGDMNSFKRIMTVEGWSSSCRKHRGARNPCPIRPPCAINDSMVMVFVDCSRYVLYDACEERVISEIRNFPERWSSILVQCQEHVFFPIRN